MRVNLGQIAAQVLSDTVGNVLNQFGKVLLTTRSYRNSTFLLNDG